MDYALDNRSEWEAKGQGIVAQLVEDAELKFGEIESPERLIRRSQARRMDGANEGLDDAIVKTKTESSLTMQPLKGNEDPEQATCSITSSNTGPDSPEEYELGLDNESPRGVEVTMLRDAPQPPVAIEPCRHNSTIDFLPTAMASPNRKKKLGVEARFI